MFIFFQSRSLAEPLATSRATRVEKPWPRRTKIYLLPFVSSTKLCFVILQQGSRVSSGSIVSDYGLDDRAIGVRSPAGAEDFSSTSVSRPALGPTQPPVNGYRGSFPRG
jgi:hypothetical protein